MINDLCLNRKTAHVMEMAEVINSTDHQPGGWCVSASQVVGWLFEHKAISQGMHRSSTKFTPQIPLSTADQEPIALKLHCPHQLPNQVRKQSSPQPACS